MAHQWFLQHGGKQYGPLSSAQLKKLAVDGKIAPTSQVRLGAEGKWAAASRVQGLFPIAPPPPATTPPATTPPPTATPGEVSSLAATPPVPPPPPPSPLDAPPRVATGVTPVGGPPTARPLTAKPLAAVIAPPPEPATSVPIAGKLLGAVGLIFGILALATFWLPLVDWLVGWTGIVVGALGLVLGVAGLVVAALQQGHGLYLNVAASSASLVGLVLTVVLGITTGMFTSAPAPPPAEPTMVSLPQATPPPAEPEPEPEPAPEPEPEIVWTDASEAIEQGPIRARIEGVGVEKIRLESADLTQISRGKAEPLLRVRVALENLTENKILAVPGWNGGGLAGGVGDLLAGSELGKQYSAATATAVLVDNHGNRYAQIPAVRLTAAQTEVNENPQLRPGETNEKHLLFEPPLEDIEYLRLELPRAGFGGAEPLRFQIGKAMLDGN